MRLPRFTNTLHFRMSALFLLLLAVSIGGFYLWMQASLFPDYVNEDEEIWFEEKAEGELDALAEALADEWPSGAPAQELLVDFVERVRHFGVELIVFDATGRLILSSNPDSLSLVVPSVDADLLRDMATPGWDYSYYPLPEDDQAYENRIFEVDLILAGGDPTGPPEGFLAASYIPLTFGVEEIERDVRVMALQALVMVLIYTALTALIIMAWTSRRIRHLSRGVEEFASGSLDQRVNAGSRDEIGSLGRHFNDMAARIQGMLEELQQKEEFQRHLIANISHDLRTPMASLRGYVESLNLRADKLSSEERNRHLDIITGNLDHLDQLVDHMLVLSRFDSGQATFRMEVFPLGELADSVMVRCEALAERHQVELELELDQKAGLVQADPLQIAQVLQNLIENAVKFNRADGKVLVRITPHEGEVLTEVKDTGNGIAPEDLPHIFDRFFTGDRSRTRHPEGTDSGTAREHLGNSSGLGLAIAAKIIRGHGRKLEVSSVMGEGTVFRFNLPAASENDLEEAEG